jgi:hypothetical protein
LVPGEAGGKFGIFKKSSCDKQLKFGEKAMASIYKDKTKNKDKSPE